MAYQWLIMVDNGNYLYNWMNPTGTQKKPYINPGKAQRECT